ncbi:MAG TPA: NADH-quinone oxidoreductase subunit C [Chloroflexota bacterium]|nr:NADH-quinone oxidoreductase subunit C [Chloroflexota bacterium]
MAVSDTLQAVFESGEVSLPADGIPTVRVPLAELLEAVEQVRGALGHSRFVDLTAVDRLTSEDRFELVYLFYSLEAHTWLRLKTRTDHAAPSITPLVPGANWYEREVFDLFGLDFQGHPNLKRLMLPDDWQGHPLRRTEPLGSEPVDFTVTRKMYGTD